MVKQTQTIRRQKPTNCLSVFDHFAGLELKGLRKFTHFKQTLPFLLPEISEITNLILRKSMFISIGKASPNRTKEGDPTG